MGVLDQVTQMKSQGMSESQIINNLRQQGVDPRSIQDAINQSQVKNAVGAPGPEQGMQQSIMSQPPMQQEEYVPSPQEPGEMQGQYQQQMPYQENYPEEYSQEASFQPQEYYPQNEYAGDYGYPQTTATDTGTLIEIAEQVFMDKIKKLQKHLEVLAEFKVLTETRISSVEERLKRIESTIDQLQSSVLDKVGSYGQNLSSIKKEMSMMQESFGKIVNKATDKYSKK